MENAIFTCVEKEEYKKKKKLIIQRFVLTVIFSKIIKMEIKILNTSKSDTVLTAELH